MGLAAEGDLVRTGEEAWEACGVWPFVLDDLVDEARVHLRKLGGNPVSTYCNANDGAEPVL